MTHDRTTRTVTHVPTRPPVRARRRQPGPSRHLRLAGFAVTTVMVGAAIVGFATSSLGLFGAGSAADLADSSPTTAERASAVGLLAVPPAPDRRATTAEATHPRTVFDGADPSVANLDPDLRDALRRMAIDAAGDGIRFTVNSGWRSAAEQAQLLRDAIGQYGSEAEARKWVATPETSEHVKGEAVDLGPTKATKWLSRHGAAYGLCQIYRNEPWHFELRPQAASEGCPAMYANATEDPRLQG